MPGRNGDEKDLREELEEAEERMHENIENGENFVPERTEAEAEFDEHLKREERRSR